MPFVVAPLAIGLLGRDKVFWLAMIGVNLAAFFLLALLCHGELYRRRPAPARLTEFYLWVRSAGLGRVFAALIAPYIFTRIYEYPILMLAACSFCRACSQAARRMLTEAGPVLCFRRSRSWRSLFDIRLPAAAELPFQVVLVALVAVMLVQRHRPARFFALVCSPSS